MIEGVPYIKTKLSTNAFAKVSACLFGIAFMITYLDRSHCFGHAYLFPESDFVNGPVVSIAIESKGF